MNFDGIQFSPYNELLKQETGGFINQCLPRFWLPFAVGRIYSLHFQHGFPVIRQFPTAEEEQSGAPNQGSVV